MMEGGLFYGNCFNSFNLINTLEIQAFGVCLSGYSLVVFLNMSISVDKFYQLNGTSFFVYTIEVNK